MHAAGAEPTDDPPDYRHRMLALAIVGEGVLLVVAVAWAYSRGLRLVAGPWQAGVLAGLATAFGLAIVQYWLLRAAPDIAPVRSLRVLYSQVLRPLFARASPTEIVVVSAMAGLGEELLFRGVMQPLWGWGAASLLFGLCHVGGRATWALGAWAGVVGAWLGWLAIWTGGLAAPVIAHAVYDALALSYIRWGGDA